MSGWRLSEDLLEGYEQLAEPEKKAAPIRRMRAGLPSSRVESFGAQLTEQRYARVYHPCQLFRLHAYENVTLRTMLSIDSQVSWHIDASRVDSCGCVCRRKKEPG